MTALAVLLSAAAAAACFLAFLAAKVYRGFFSPPWHQPTHDRRRPLGKTGLPLSWGSKHTDPLHDLGLPFSDVSFAGPSGEMHGWLVPGPQGGGAVGLVLVHGAGRDRRAWLRHVPVFHAAGYTLLLFDCSGHGASDGRGLGVSYGHRESQDVVAAADFLRERCGLERVAAVGTSQGAASSLIAAASAGAGRISAVVAENPFYTAEMMIDHILHLVRVEYLPRPLRLALAPLLPLWAAAVGVLLRWRLRQLHSAASDASPLGESARVLLAELAEQSADGTTSPADAAARLEQPVLVMHAEGDKLIPFRHSQLVYDAATRSAHRELWIAEGGEHCAVYDAHPDEWRSRVLAFLAANA